MNKKTWIMICWMCAAVILFQTPEELHASTVEVMENDSDETELLEEILKLLNFQKMDTYTEGITQHRLSFSELVKAIVFSQKSGITKEQVTEAIVELIWKQFFEIRSLLAEIVILAIISAIHKQLISDKHFYTLRFGFLLIYGAIAVLLMQMFLNVTDLVTIAINRMLGFATALIPTYAAVLTITGNMNTAAFFYEMCFGIIYGVEWGMKLLLLPGIHLYVLLVLFDGLFEENRFLAFAQFVSSMISFFRKAAVGGVLGIGAIQSLLAPAKDRIAQNTILKTLTIIPGIGNGIHVTEEIVLSCGSLVKNGVGIAGVIMLLIICLPTILQLLFLRFVFQLLGALLQPILDKRVIGELLGVEKGIGMLLKVMVDTMLLFLICILIVAMSSGNAG